MLADPALRDLLHQRPGVPPLPAAHAPIASGWSNSAGWVIFLPLDQRALSTAHDFLRVSALPAAHFQRNQAQGIQEMVH
jgi:hypothetical protein